MSKNTISGIAKEEKERWRRRRRGKQTARYWKERTEGRQRRKEGLKEDAEGKRMEDA
jgi:hypothetical protein